MATQAERILDALSQYATECDLERSERSKQFYGHPGASIPAAGATRAGRLAAVQAILDGTTAPIFNTDVFATIGLAVIASGFTITNPPATQGRYFEVHVSPGSDFSVYLAADGSFVAAHGPHAHISVRNRDVDAHTGLTAFLDILASLSQSEAA